MEGPSLHLAQEQLQPFVGQTVKKVTGNAKTLDISRLQHQTVQEIFSWGKHLVFQFDDFAIRFHFLLFGTFAAQVEGESVTGDYQRKSKEPRLALTFPSGAIQTYNCSVKLYETANLKSSYDFSIDVMSPAFDQAAALRRLRNQPDAEIADVLLDQDIFAGVGNIIKNEVLFLNATHPRTRVRDLTDEKLRQMITTTVSFSHQFYDWRKQFVLKKNLQVYRQKSCPKDGTKIVREATGQTHRWSYYCPTCQKPPAGQLVPTNQPDFTPRPANLN